MDKIIIEDLEVFANHGVFPEENVLGQKFVISAVLYTDTRSAGKNDDLTKSIHYGIVSQMITDFLQQHTYKLIETCAEQLAAYLLRTVENLEKITLTIKKPWAPVRLPLKTVGVSITRSWHTAYVALGSNIGDVREYLDGAIRELKEHEDCRVEAIADYIVTKPYGGVEQDDFVNSACKVRTLLTPEELLDALHVIEQNAGRERLIHWGPRTLDLDIIFYDDIVMETKDLIIPHVDMHNRDFVLDPMVQIAPFYKHPVFGKTMLQLRGEL